MCVLDAPNRTFRLVVQLDDCEIVRDSLRFTQYKQALSHVATAIRDHGHEGALNEVILQKAGPATCADLTTLTNQPATESWVDVERWGPDVVRRVLAQERLRRRDRVPPAARPSPTPSPRALMPAARKPRRDVLQPDTPASVTPKPVPPAQPLPIPQRPVEPRVEHKSHRSRAWYVVVGVTIVAGTWLSILAYMCGGQPGNILRSLEMREPPADAEAIAFEGPVVLPEPEADEP